MVKVIGKYQKGNDRGEKGKSPAVDASLLTGKEMEQQPT